MNNEACIDAVETELRRRGLPFDRAAVKDFVDTARPRAFAASDPVRLADAFLHMLAWQRVAEKMRAGESGEV
jgi:predicted RNase H-like nuclease